MRDDNIVLSELRTRLAKHSTHRGIGAALQLEDEAICQDRGATLRRKLQLILNNRFEDQDVLTDVHEVLMMLAELWPLNDRDPASLQKACKWTQAERVVVSTGHQFQLSTLIDYHHARSVRRDEDLSVRNKCFLNPITNQSLHHLDVQHIQRIASDSGLTIKDLVMYFDPNKLEDETLPSAFDMKPASSSRHAFFNKAETESAQPVSTWQMIRALITGQSQDEAVTITLGTL